MSEDDHQTTLAPSDPKYYAGKHDLRIRAYLAEISAAIDAYLDDL